MPFWRVNSYGYPSPFSESEKAKNAWETFLSFSEIGSYGSVKAYWSGTRAPRRIDPHTVESWKAAFEGFGLLFVLSREDEVHITPAGRQVIAAAVAGDEREFARVGLTVLTRYPIQGGPRRPRYRDANADADLLLYRFFLSALLDLDGRLSFSEIQHILSPVLRTSDAPAAIESVRRLRRGEATIQDFPLPTRTVRGQFYNSLNQVPNHASLNYLVLNQDRVESPYRAGESDRLFTLSDGWRPLVEEILGGPSACAAARRWTDRLPAAPVHADERAYFAYLGAPVAPRAPRAGLPTADVAGDTIAVLSERSHYDLVQADGRTPVLVGPAASLCGLARGQRVVLSHDLGWSFLITEKEVAGDDRIRVTARRAKPISDAQPFYAHIITPHV